MKKPHIIAAGILDTKGREICFLKECIIKAGGEALVMELSVGKETKLGDITLSEVLAADGITLEHFMTFDRAGRAKLLSKAAAVKLNQLHEAGLCDGVVAYGGSMGATIATYAMRALPLGVPKMMLSTINGQMRAYAGSRDICMMYSVAEAGLNKVTRKILNNAAYGIVGMASAVEEAVDEKPLVGCMMFGVTTPCVIRASFRMEEAGYDVIVNHATGSGGRSFEELIEEGYLAGVLDITTHEVVSDIYHTRDTSGPQRLRTAATKGIPQVISLGGVDFFLYEDDEKIPDNVLAEADARGVYVHNPSVVNYGIDLEESKNIAHSFADRLNGAKAPCVICIPMEGWCANDHPPGENEPQGLLWMGSKEYPGISARSLAFAEGLKCYLSDETNPNIEVLLLDRHINDNDVADLMSELLLKMLEGSWQKGDGTQRDWVHSLRQQDKYRID